MKSSRFHSSAGWIGILAIIVACPFSGIPSSKGAPNQTATEDTSGVSSDETLTQADAWVSATLAMRSVTLELATVYSGKESKTVSAQIDAAGNIHLSMPTPTLEAVANTPDFPQPGDFELFVVNGSAYTRMGQENPASQDEAYQSMLQDILLGPEGPGLWLSLVPESGFVRTGTESFGGFDATAYAINYQIEQGTLTGTIRVDDKAEGLVGAELTVSEGLFFPPGSNQSGDVHITLTVQQADVPTITLP